MNADDLAEEDPWAPLPPDRLVLRPGEVEPAHDPRAESPHAGTSHTGSPRAESPQGGSPQGVQPPVGALESSEQPEPPTTRRPSAPPSAEALAKLAELQQRCAKAGSGDSLVSRFERRRSQQQRKSRVAANAAVSASGARDLVGATDAVEPAAPAGPADAAGSTGSVDAADAADPTAASACVEHAASAAEQECAPVSPDPGSPTHDPREDEAWFRQLPDSEQKRLHDVWAHKRDAAVCGERVERRKANHRMVQAWVCFAATILLGQGFGWHATIGAGIVCGIWWRHAQPDRLLDPLRALICLIVLQVLAMAVAEAVNPGLGLDAVILISIAAVVGFDGEIRRTGMFDGRPGPRRGA